MERQKQCALDSREHSADTLVHRDSPMCRRFDCLQWNSRGNYAEKNWLHQVENGGYCRCVNCVERSPISLCVRFKTDLFVKPLLNASSGTTCDGITHTLGAVKTRGRMVLEDKYWLGDREIWWNSHCASCRCTPKSSISILITLAVLVLWRNIEIWKIYYRQLTSCEACSPLTQLRACTNSSMRRRFSGCAPRVSCRRCCRDSSGPYRRAETSSLIVIRGMGPLTLSIVDRSGGSS